jgi:hypothetical protein
MASATVFARINWNGEKILVCTRPTCPHCSSRKNVEDDPRSVIRDEEGEVIVWTCLCPTHGGRPTHFGVIGRPEDIRGDLYQKGLQE